MPPYYILYSVRGIKRQGCHIHRQFINCMQSLFSDWVTFCICVYVTSSVFTSVSIITTILFVLLELKTCLEELLYKVYEIMGSNKSNVLQSCKRLAEYEYPATCRRILVYFCGHGNEEGMKLTFTLPGDESLAIDDLIKEFKPDNACRAGLKDIIKMVFIDLQPLYAKYTTVAKGAIISTEANVFVAYGFSPSSSTWTNYLISTLQERDDTNDDIYSVFTEVHKLIRDDQRCGTLPAPKFIARGIASDGVVHFKKEAKERNDYMKGILLIVIVMYC